LPPNLSSSSAVREWNTHYAHWSQIKTFNIPKYPVLNPASEELIVYMDYWCCPYDLLGQRLEEVQAVLHTPEKDPPFLPVFELFPIAMDRLSWLRLVVGM